MVGLTGRNTILRKICIEASPASGEYGEWTREWTRGTKSPFCPGAAYICIAGEQMCGHTRGLLRKVKVFVGCFYLQEFIYLFFLKN